jgi:hypothetical protein
MYANANRVLKGFGRFSLLGGFILDGFAYKSGEISGGKFGLNSAVTGWGLGIGAMGGAIPAFIGTTFYYGVDTFAPGGWEGAMKIQEQNYRSNKAIIPDWQPIPGAMKQ